MHLVQCVSGCDVGGYPLLHLLPFGTPAKAESMVTDLYSVVRSQFFEARLCV
jgi:hypothetical protein